MSAMKRGKESSPNLFLPSKEGLGDLYCPFCDILTLVWRYPSEAIQSRKVILYNLHKFIVVEGVCTDMYFCDDNQDFGS